MATLEAAAGPAATELSAHRLVRGYRRWLWIVAAPLFALLALLAAGQASTAQRAAIGDLERRSIGFHAAAQALALSVVDHVADLRRQVERDLRTPPHSPDAALQSGLAVRGSAGQPDGYTLDNLASLAQSDSAQLLWPHPAIPPDAGTLWRLQSFSSLASLAQQRNADVVWSYYFAWPQRHIVMLPWVRTDRLIEQLGQENQLAAVAAWYGYEVFTAGVQAHAAYWTRAYIDAGGAGLVVSHAAPVLSEGAFRGVVGSDIKLAALTRLLAAQPPGAGRWWVIDRHGDVLAPAPPAAAGAASSGSTTVAAITAGAAAPTVPTLRDRLPPGIDNAALAQALAAGGHAVHIAGHRAVALELAAAPWVVLCTLSDAEVMAQVLPGQVPFLVIGLVLLALFLFGQNMLRRRLIEPALNVMGYLEAMSRDAAAREPQLGRRWQPWVAAVTATFRAQREARERERRSEDFKAAIVDNALVALVTADAEGRIVEFNPSAERLFARSRSSVLGLSVAEVVIPERLRAAHQAGMGRLKAGAGGHLFGKRMEMQALRSDGSEFTAEMVLWRTEVAGSAHYTASLSDVSAARDAAREIERQREALRQAEKLTTMGSLLAGVAHELNNPLAIVMGRADLLADKYAQNTELQSELRRMREAADRCGRIVRTFLNMARNRPTMCSSVSLNELARAAGEMLGYALRSHGIELILELDPHLPAVQADGDQIAQVVLNLLVNAQQVLMSAPGPRRVWLATGTAGASAATGEAASVWLSVTDSGPGIDEALVPRLFEPFFTTKAEGLGTGLGLTLSRSLVREHGGDLMLHSARQFDGNGRSGACFRMSLPGRPESECRATPPHDGMRVEAAQQELLAPTAPTVDADGIGTTRLLVVDDEPEFAEMMRSMLEPAGYEVSVAESGAIALELLGEVRHDAIVSDLRMPDMDGAALWREIARRDPPLSRRMLFVTGDALSGDARRFLLDSGCPSLDKPFTKQELLRKLGAWL